ncbi:MAG: VWA domain-containing protein [Blastocatellia bacterium]|nr:VWA domain-containing protein [Blastocatellia bacterium]
MTRHQKKHSVQTQTASSPRRRVALSPRRLLFVALAVVGVMLGAPLRWAQQQGSAPQKPQEQAAIRIGSEEVLLDVVARDKKGRPITDLKPEEIEVFEDGVRQQVTSFRKVDRTQLGETEAPAAPAAGGRPAAGASAKPAAVVDPLRQINLVTMIFERLNNESRVLARDAATEFLKSELRPNTMVAVFSLDQRMNVLQQFTNNYDRLKQAVDRATGAASTQFSEQSESIRRELETMVSAQTSVDSLSANAQQTGGQGIGASAVAAKLAEMTINTLRTTDEAQRQMQGASSLFSLLAMVKEQRRLAGRKTVLYFTEGLKVTPNLTDIFRSTISAANRANVSFYTVDARGLQTGRQTEEAREALNAAVSASQQQQRSRGNQPVTREQAKAFDTAEDSILKNSQDNLAALAESTGGFLIANTNDIRTPVKRIGAEIANYYELSYSPTAREYDGRFREIKVNILRPDVVIQTRNGYFAVPPNESGGPPVLGYELPMLTALSSARLPRDFDFRATAMRFESDESGTHYAMTFEVPIANLTVQADPEKKLYRTRFALMAVVKGADGGVVQRFSQDYPLEGPLDRLEGLKRGNVVFVRNFRLAPGRYTLETVAHDREPNRLSARRAILIVPPPRATIGMSSVSVIKRVDAVDAGVKDPDNPFRFADGKIIPNLGDPILPTKDAKISFYFIVYPAAAPNEKPAKPPKPTLLLEFLLDGEVIARATPDLPGPDARGRIPYIATVPMETFKGGRYEVRAVVQQGAQSAEEHAFFTIVGQEAK